MHPCPRHFLLVLVAILAFTLPATAQDVPATPDPAASSATVVLFNDSGKTLIPGNQKVTDNGQPLASLPRQTYVKLTLPAGRHVLRPDPYLWKQQVVLDLAPGATHYVVVAYKPGRSWAAPVGGAPLVLTEISSEAAQPLLESMRPLTP